MFVDKNLVAHDHSHEGDESEDARETNHAIHDAKTDERAGQHQAQGDHAERGDAEPLEVEQQEEENDNHRNDDAPVDLRHVLIVVLQFSAQLSAHAFWQL